MKRRQALKSLIMASGGLVALPSWAVGWSKGDVTSRASTFSSAEQGLLASVADTCIPEGNGIGALSVGVDKFLVRLLEECYEKDIQDNVRNQLNQLNAIAERTTGMDFPQCMQLRREELLLAFADSDDEDSREFFDLLKSETIRGFRTSREVMVDYLDYQLMPGHYDGCVDVEA